MNLAKPITSELVKFIFSISRIRMSLSYEQQVYNLTQKHMGLPPGFGPPGRAARNYFDGIEAEQSNATDGIDGDNKVVQHTVAKVGLETLKSIMHAARDELCAYVLHVGNLMYMKLNGIKDYHTLGPHLPIGGPQLGLWALISSKERPTLGKFYIPVELSMPITDYVNDSANQFHGFYLFGAEDPFGPKRFGE